MYFGFGELFVVVQVFKVLVLFYQDKFEVCLKVVCYWLFMVLSNQLVFCVSLFCVQVLVYVLFGDYVEVVGVIGFVWEDLKVVDSEYLQVVISLIEFLICKESGDLEWGRVIVELVCNWVEQVFGWCSWVGGFLLLVYVDLFYEQDWYVGVFVELLLVMVWWDVVMLVELFSCGQLVMVKVCFFFGVVEQGLV